MSASKRVGVVLSGCGFKDGAEIHESVLTLLALDRARSEILCFAPDLDQALVVDHATGDQVAESRNVRVEAARIARGEIRDLKEARAAALDALVLPGGFGAALTLCDFGSKGADGSVNEDLAALLRAMHDAKKPIGAICIAPGAVALALGDRKPTLTIGNDPGTAQAIEACGAVHRDCLVDDCVVDAENRIASTPAYMLGPSIAHVAAGIDRCVAEVLAMA